MHSRTGRGEQRALMRLRLLLPLLTLAVAPRAMATPDCQQALLESLGWRFTTAPVATPVIATGQPCDRANLAEAQAAGDLRVLLPVTFDPASRAALQARLLAEPATTCAFGFRLGDATRRAVDALATNRGFRFSGLQVGWIGFGPTGAARDGWTPIAPFGRGYIPRAGNWNAIQAFTRGQVRAECGVGRQVAQFAAQAALFGPQGFDAAFDAGEIAIGAWHVLNRSGGILQGASAGVLTRDGLARNASSQGRQAFMGVPGYIGHVFDRGHLDDIHNQAQNFVVYDVSPEAATALRQHGGFAYYNARMRDAWRLSRTLPAAGRRPFQRLLSERDPALRSALSPAQRDTLAQIDAVLDDPFFRGFRVYVHRQGVQPIGYHLVRMLDRNPRTPFKVEFALHNVHTTLMRRWLDYRLQACSAGIMP